MSKLAIQLLTATFIVAVIGCDDAAPKPVSASSQPSSVAVLWAEAPNRMERWSDSTKLSASAEHLAIGKSAYFSFYVASVGPSTHGGLIIGRALDSGAETKVGSNDRSSSNWPTFYQCLAELKDDQLAKAAITKEGAFVTLQGTVTAVQADIDWINHKVLIRYTLGSAAF